MSKTFKPDQPEKMLTVSQAMGIIRANKKVAIVGLSPKTDRPSYQVGSFLLDRGYDITPIHPTAQNILGVSSKSSLKDLQPDEVDWIDLFLNPSRLMDLLPELKRLRPKLIWCQLGVVMDEFNQQLEQDNLPYIVDHCPVIEWGCP